MIGPRRSIPPSFSSSSSCTKATRARSEERIPLPGIYFEAGKNRFRKRSAQFTRGRSFSSRIHGLFLESCIYSSSGDTLDRTFREIISSRAYEGRRGKWILLIPSPLFDSLFFHSHSFRIHSNIGNHLARSVGKITPINRCFPLTTQLRREGN